MTKKNKRFA